MLSAGGAARIRADLGNQQEARNKPPSAVANDEGKSAATAVSISSRNVASGNEREIKASISQEHSPVADENGHAGANQEINFDESRIDREDFQAINENIVLSSEKQCPGFEDIEPGRENGTTNSTLPKRAVLFREKTMVSRADTFVSIAETIFHDPNLASLIVDLNWHVVRESSLDGKRLVEIRSRQVIELPTVEEIKAFYLTRTARTNPDNIITIVSESAVDAELLDMTLGPLVGARGLQRQPDPVATANNGTYACSGATKTAAVGRFISAKISDFFTANHIRNANTRNALKRNNGLVLDESL